MYNDNEINFTKNGNKSFVTYARPEFPPLRKRKDSYSKMKVRAKRLIDNFKK